MKKVLFLLPSMNIGGTEKAFINMISEPLFCEQYDVTLMLLKKEGGFLDYLPDWVHIEKLDGYEGFSKELSLTPKKAIISRLKKGNFIAAFKYIIGHLHFRRTQDRVWLWNELATKHKLGHDIHYDIAISYLGPDDFLSFLVLWMIEADSKIQWIHFDVKDYTFHEYFAQKYYQLFDQINVVSEESKDSLLQRLPSLKEKIKVVTNVCSPVLCNKLADEDAGFTDDFRGFRIVTVGRLSEEKGQLVIVEIAERLVQAGKIFKWYLIGEGPLRMQLTNQIKEKKLTKTVILLGAKTNPYPYMKQADLYVQPSLHEGYGLTIAEAKALNKYIIASDIPSFGSQLIDYKDSTTLPIDAVVFAKEILKHITP